MLVNMTVKRVMDFHGHLCPELVIGMKACEDAEELLFPEYAPTYVSCSGCGEGVLLERAIPFQGKPYCIPCFHLLNGSESGQSLH